MANSLPTLSPSTMSADWSAIRRRQTLAEVQNHANPSQIPQPASVLKKSAGRASVAPGGLGPAPRSSLAPQRFFRSSSAGNIAGDAAPAASVSSSQASSQRDSLRNSRQSYAPQTSFNGRRSSTYTAGRPSSIGFLSQASTHVQKDPRPVKDKAFVANCQRSILEYLISANYPVPISLKTLQVPTSKDFATIFKFLYHRLDPNYQFMKKIEDEVILCLKALKYPFVDSMSKSNISAVGSQHSWPGILAMLNWMVDVSEKLMLGEIQTEEYDANFPERVFFDYLADAYSQFFAGQDDFGESERQLEQQFDNRNAERLADIERLQEENDQLIRELAQLNVDAPPLEVVEREKNTLLSDKEKFVQYITHLENKSKKLKELNIRIRDELVDKEKELENCQVEKGQLQGQVDRQSISPADVDRMTAEREKLVQGLEQMSAKVDEARKTAWDKELTAQKKVETIEKLIQSYNTLGYRIGIIPVSGPHSGGIVFELDFNAAAATGGSQVRPDQLVNRDLRHEVRGALMKLRERLGGEVHKKQDEAIQVQEQLDRIVEGLVDKKDELEGLEAKVAAAMEQFSEIKDTMTAETSASNAEMEKLERELQQMRITAQNGMLQLEQRCQSVGIEYDQLVHASHAIKEDVYREVVRILEEVIKFKLHVQTGLENLQEELDGVMREAIEETM